MNLTYILCQNIVQKNSDWIHRDKLWPSKKQQETNYVDFYEASAVDGIWTINDYAGPR